MDFVKRNLFLLICAVVGLASFGGIVWGVTRMAEVTTKMQDVARLDQSLAGYTRTPMGVPHVTNEYDRIIRVDEHHKAMLDHFTRATSYAPLMEGLLPDPTGSEEENKRLRYDFRPAYQNAMRALMDILHAGTPPSREEIADVADYLKRKEMEAELTTQTPAPTPVPPSATPSAPGAATPAQPELPKREGPASCQTFWEALAQLAAGNADTLASIGKARSIYCYADLGTGGSFDLHSVYQDQTYPPNLDEIWFAHMYYWPQRQVVDVLAAVNDRAAEELRSAGEHPWVGNLPVKDIRSVRVSGYILPESQTPAGHGEELPPEDPAALFTRHHGHNLYDVVNLRLQLIIDVRDLLELLNEFTHQRYITVANLNYEHMPSDTKFTGKIYGPEPIVDLTLDIQMYLCYRAMVPLMPAVIRERLGTQEQFEELVGHKDEKTKEDG